MPTRSPYVRMLFGGQCTPHPSRARTYKGTSTIGPPIVARNRPNRREHVPAPIRPDEAAAAVNEATAILRRKHFGLLGCFVKCRTALPVLLAIFLYWNFLRTPRLKISSETTHITEPLTSDGTRVDYFAALERDLYPPGMKTEENGYRLIVRTLGYVTDDRGEESLRTQAYEKPGIVPALESTMTYTETHDFLRDYCTIKGLDAKTAEELNDQVYRPWTLGDLPMMKSWLEKNGPVPQ